MRVKSPQQVFNAVVGAHSVLFQKNPFQWLIQTYLVTIHSIGPTFHPPTSLPSLHDYIQPTISSFSSHPSIWCNHYHSSFHLSDQCPYIEYSLGLGQNQFLTTFQRPMIKSCPSNFNSGWWNYSNSSWTNHILVHNSIGPHGSITPTIWVQ